MIRCDAFGHGYGQYLCYVFRLHYFPTDSVAYVRFVN